MFFNGNLLAIPPSERDIRQIFGYLPIAKLFMIALMLSIRKQNSIQEFCCHIQLLFYLIIYVRICFHSHFL